MIAWVVALPVVAVRVILSAVANGMECAGAVIMVGVVPIDPRADVVITVVNTVAVALKIVVPV